MTKSKKVFITSSVFYSFIDRNNLQHTQAEAFFRFFAQEKMHIYSSLGEILETQEKLQESVGFGTAKDFLRTVFLGSVDITYPDERDTKNALKLVLTSSSSSQTVTFSQALINTICDRHQIPQVATFDYIQFYFGIGQFILPF